jgi:hypothetical protein
VVSLVPSLSKLLGDASSQTQASAVHSDCKIRRRDLQFLTDFLRFFFFEYAQYKDIRLAAGQSTQAFLDDLPQFKVLQRAVRRFETAAFPLAFIVEKQQAGIRLIRQGNSAPTLPFSPNDVRYFSSHDRKQPGALGRLGVKLVDVGYSRHQCLLQSFFGEFVVS